MLIFAGIGLGLWLLQVLLQAVFGGGTEVTTISTDGGGEFSYTTASRSTFGLVISFVFAIISFVWQYVVNAAFVRGGLKLTAGEPIELKDLLTLDRIGRIIVAAILLAIATTIGLILCILPGLLVIFFGTYYLFFILDQDLGAIDSIKASFQFVSSNAGPIFLVLLISWAFLLVGALLCGVGLLVAMPVVVLLQTYTYKGLRGVPVAE